MSDKYRIELNFDLKIERLKEYYPGKNWQKAWNDVKKYLEANGFKHTLFSGYISEKTMSVTAAHKIMRKMNKEMPWVFESATGFHLTRAYGNELDVKKFIEHDSKIKGKNKETKIEKVSAKDVPGKTPKAEEKTSIRSQIADAENKLERKEQNKGKVKDSGLEL